MNENTKIAIKIAGCIVLLAISGIVIAKVYPEYVAPCAKPIVYSIGSMDAEFNLSREEFISAIADAERIWENRVDKELFSYHNSGGELTINLTYDYRQEATDKLKSLGYKIENTQTSYSSLSQRYDSLMQTYNQLKAELDAKIAQFEARKRTYETQVEKWNKQGGAPKNEAAKLEAEYKTLNTLAADINREKDNFNALVSEVNALVGILNNLATQLKLNVSNYNTIGQSRGQEFEEGVYVKDETGTSINIFEFSDRDQLVRLMAHELGHALGLEHVDDPQAVMYRLNQAQNGALTNTDITELERVRRFNL